MCTDCGGALTSVRPASVTAVPRDHVPRGRQREAWPVLLASEDPGYSEAEARSIAAEFNEVRSRAKGFPAAPASWLPVPGDKLAGALDIAAGTDPDHRVWRAYREALVDLQAFISDEEAAAAMRVKAGTATDAKDEHVGRAGLERVRKAQAAVISFLREDETGAVGAYNALGGIDIVVGEAERSLAAVERYKEAQAAAIGSLVLWPVLVAVGGFVGVLLFGLSLLGVAAVAVVAAAGFFIALGPLYGGTVGDVGARFGIAAHKIRAPILAGLLRVAVTVLAFGLLLGGPALLGVVLMAVSRQARLP